MIPSFVTFKWKPFAGYRSEFCGAHVNTLFSMIGRNYAKPHRRICVTDDANGIDPSIEIVPLWSDFAELMSPHGKRFPSCYRRLKLFSRQARETFGDRIVQIDLDAVITADIAPLIDTPEEFRAWGDTNRAGGYNGSFIVMNAGTRPQVWELFDPIKSPQASRAADCIGSDQGWISCCLGKDTEAKFRQADGVYSFQNDMLKSPLRNPGDLPANARIVFFHGNTDPWSPAAQRLAWVNQHYH